MDGDDDESPDRRRARLMMAAQAGDRRAYERLLRESMPLIRAAARRRGVAADRIDDVVQDVLVTVHRVRATFDGSRSFDAWLAAIATRRAIDALRTSGRHAAREVFAPAAYEAFADAGPPPSTGVEEADTRRVVREAVAGLPARQREAVDALALREQSLAEAAAATGQSKGALKVSLFRAVRSLRMRIGGPEDRGTAAGEDDR